MNEITKLIAMVAAVIVVASLLGSYLCMTPYLDFGNQFENPDSTNTATAITGIIKCWVPNTTKIGIVSFLIVGLAQVFLEQNGL